LLFCWGSRERGLQEHRDALEKRRADEFRKMDLELRHLNQTLSRLRIEWESEKSQREKAEARLHKLSTFLDVRGVAAVACYRGDVVTRPGVLVRFLQETKSHTEALEEEAQQLKTQLHGTKRGQRQKES